MTTEQETELETFVIQFVDAQIGLDAARPSIIRKGAYIRIDAIFPDNLTKEDRIRFYKRIYNQADKQEWKETADALIEELAHEKNNFGNYVLHSVSGAHVELVSCSYQEGKEP
jgi:hypothetical protein